MHLILDLIYQWSQRNLDIVFFIYGLAFVIMGIAIWVQPKKDSAFKLANILWLLAGFGLTHGTNEFLDMWAIIKGRSPVLDIVRSFILIVSYLFLFEFGRRLIRICGQKYLEKITKLFGWRLTLVIGLAVFIFGFISTDFWKIGTIWGRYLLGFPGGLLISFGFVLCYECEKKEIGPVKVKKYFFCAGVSFLIYGILGGLVVPKADFFPSNWINTDSFLSVVHIPVQIFRTICAVIISWATVGILKIFKWEDATRLKNAFILKEKIADGIEEGIMLIDKDFKVLWANKREKELYENIEGDHCYHTTHQRDTACQPPNDICPIEGVLRTGKSVTTIHTHFDKMGNKIFVEVSAYPIKDWAGKIVEFVHISRDITERKKSEEDLKLAYAKLKETQDYLIQAEKLNAVSLLSGGVAHEIRNPLGIIIQGVNYLEKRISSKEEDIFETLTVLKNSVKRVNKIINGLLDFSRATTLNLQPEDINSILENSLSLVKNQFELEHIEITRELKTDIPKVLADKNKIEQVCINILLNAAQAMPEGGKIIIRSYDKQLEEIKNGIGKRAEDHFRVGEKTVIVEFEDTGIGISEENISKIFDPFFTTKGPRGGTGLGLSVSRNILHMHKGLIYAESQVGKGTKLTIILKIAGR